MVLTGTGGTIVRVCPTVSQLGGSSRIDLIGGSGPYQCRNSARGCGAASSRRRSPPTRGWCGTARSTVGAGGGRRRCYSAVVEGHEEVPGGDTPYLAAMFRPCAEKQTWSGAAGDNQRVSTPREPIQPVRRSPVRRQTPPRSRRVGRATKSRADQIVLDIEDAVDPKNKDSAREDVATWLESDSGVGAGRRPHHLLVRRRRPRLPGLAGGVHHQNRGRRARDRDRGGEHQVLALIKSAIGIEEARSGRVHRGALQVGVRQRRNSRRDTGTSSDDPRPWPTRARGWWWRAGIRGCPARSTAPRSATASRCCADTPPLAVSLGLTGKLCLDEDQLGVINEVISPTPSDVGLGAGAFLADFEARGRVVADEQRPAPPRPRPEDGAPVAEAFGVTPS